MGGLLWRGGMWTWDGNNEKGSAREKCRGRAFRESEEYRGQLGCRNKLAIEHCEWAKWVGNEMGSSWQGRQLSDYAGLSRLFQCCISNRVRTRTFWLSAQGHFVLPLATLLQWRTWERIATHSNKTQAGQALEGMQEVTVTHFSLCLPGDGTLLGFSCFDFHDSHPVQTLKYGWSPYEQRNTPVLLWDEQIFLKEKFTKYEMKNRFPKYRFWTQDPSISYYVASVDWHRSSNLLPSFFPIQVPPVIWTLGTHPISWSWETVNLCSLCHSETRSQKNLIKL